MGTLGESAAGEIVMVGGSKEEDTLAIWINVSIRTSTSKNQGYSYAFERSSDL